MLTSNDAVKRAVKKEMLLIFNRLHRTVTTNTLFCRLFGSQSSVSLDPHESVSDPHESVSDPHESVSDPHESVSDPHESVSDPHESVSDHLISE